MPPVGVREPTSRRVTVSGIDPSAGDEAVARARGAARPAVVIALASWQLDAAATACALTAAFAPAPVFACTSHGEIGERGDHEGTVTAIALASPGLRVGIGLAPELSRQAL